MDSAGMEAKAILQDRSERVRSGESARGTDILLFNEAKLRWDAALSEFAAHRVSHFAVPTTNRRVHRPLP